MDITTYYGKDTKTLQSGMYHEAQASFEKL